MTQKMPWFRAYTEMVDDEKLRLLAFEDRWHFVALLCLKGQGLIDEGGSLLMRKVAVKLGLSVREVEEVARRLAEVGLIDATTLQPLAWDSRQMKSDSSAERVKAYRERQKQGKKPEENNGNAACNVTGNGGCNVTVTAQDTDTDTDKEEGKPSLSPDESDDQQAAAKSPKAEKLPACPHQEILAAFAEILPELPQPKPELWDGARAKALAARWRWCLTAKRSSDGKRYATNRAEALAWFGKFFRYIRRCPHLMGENQRGWTADLAWLCKAENFAKVQQGNYEAGAA